MKEITLKLEYEGKTYANGIVVDENNQAETRKKTEFLLNLVRRTLEKLLSGKEVKQCCGIIQTTPDRIPYNPLSDNDCGTDAVIGRR